MGSKILYIYVVFFTLACAQVPYRKSENVDKEETVTITQVTNKEKIKLSEIEKFDSYQRLDKINKNTFEYEIALSEYVYDLKHIVMESMNSGNSMLGLYYIHEGIKKVPFRGDLINLKKNILSEYIKKSNELFSYNEIDCSSYIKRKIILRKVAPDLENQLINKANQCPEKIDLEIKSESLNLKDFVSDNYSEKSGIKDKYHSFYTFEYPEKEVLVEGIKLLRNFKIRSTYLLKKQNQKRKLQKSSNDYNEKLLWLGYKMNTPEDQWEEKLKFMYYEVKDLIIQGGFESSYSLNEVDLSDYCNRIYHILYYDGEYSKIFKCNGIEFPVTPLAYSKLSNYNYHKIPLYVVLKLKLFFKDDKELSYYALGELRAKADNSYIKLENVFAEKNKNRRIGTYLENVTFFNNVKEYEYYEKNKVESISLNSEGYAITLSIPTTRNLDINNLVGFELNIDLEETYRLNEAENTSKLRTVYIESLNKKIDKEK